MSLGEILAEDNTSIKSFIFGGTFAEDGPFESNEGYLPRAGYLALDERISIRLSYVDWIFLNSVSRYFKLSYIYCQVRNVEL